MTQRHNKIMGTTERRAREKQQRRTVILDTARQLFFTQGFRDTTIDDIAHAAELARGTIYLYFEGKEEIYATVLEAGLDMLHTMIQASQDPQGDPLTNLLAGNDAFMAFHDQHAAYYNVLMLDKMQVLDALPVALRARLNEKFVALAQIMEGVLREGVTRGHFRPLPAMEVAYLQMGIAMGFAQMLDKCAEGGSLFSDRAQTRQVMHDLIAMSVVRRG